MVGEDIIAAAAEDEDISLGCETGFMPEARVIAGYTHELVPL